MADGPGRAATVARRAGLAVLYVLATVFALAVFIRPPGMDALERVRFGDFIYGRAYRPFVGRVLVPWVARAVVAVTPETARAAASAAIRTRFTHGGKPEYVNDYPYETAVVVGLLFLCLVGFAYSLRRLAGSTLRVEGWRQDLIPVPALLFLPCMYVYMSFVYDFATLFLFTFGLAMMAERRWAWFAAAFILGTVNKESTILLTLVWLVYFRKHLSHRQLLIGVVAQVLAWAVIRGGISLLFAHNPGVPLEWHLDRNIHRLTHLGYYVAVRGPVSILKTFGTKALAAAGLIAVLFVRRTAPEFLKDAFWVIVPLLVLCLFFGFLEEARDYYEFYPLGILLLAHGFGRWFRRRKPVVLSGLRAEVGG